MTYKLLWDGEYYWTDKGLTVDLVLSFKDRDIRRASIHRSIRVDLKSVQSADSNTVFINFMGYDRLIKYEY